MSLSDDDLFKGAYGLVLAVYAWVLKVVWNKVDKDQSRHCVDRTSCKEDRDGIGSYVREIKSDINTRIDRMEDTILAAIKGEK